jgi:hypothetical protein
LQFLKYARFLTPERIFWKNCTCHLDASEFFTYGAEGNTSWDFSHSYFYSNFSNLTDLCPDRIVPAQSRRNFLGHLYKILNYVKKFSLNKLRTNQPINQLICNICSRINVGSPSNLNLTHYFLMHPAVSVCNV